MASATRHAAAGLFLDLIEPLGTTVDVVLRAVTILEMTEDLYREHIDVPVLKIFFLILKPPAQRRLHWDQS